MELFIEKNGAKLGPLSEEEVLAGVDRGEYRESDLAMIAGRTGWWPLSTFIVRETEDDDAEATLNVSPAPPLPKFASPEEINIKTTPLVEPSRYVPPPPVVSEVAAPPLKAEEVPTPSEAPAPPPRTPLLAQWPNSQLRGVAGLLVGLGCAAMLLARTPYLIYLPLLLTGLFFSTLLLQRRRFVSGGLLLAAGILLPLVLWFAWLRPAQQAALARERAVPSPAPSVAPSTVAERPPEIAPPAPAPAPETSFAFAFEAIPFGHEEAEALRLAGVPREKLIFTGSGFNPLAGPSLAQLFPRGLYTAPGSGASHLHPGIVRSFQYSSSPASTSTLYTYLDAADGRHKVLAYAKAEFGEKLSGPALQDRREEEFARREAQLNELTKVQPKKFGIKVRDGREMRDASGGTWEDPERRTILLVTSHREVAAGVESLRVVARTLVVSKPAWERYLASEAIAPKPQPQDFEREKSEIAARLVNGILYEPPAPRAIATPRPATPAASPTAARPATPSPDTMPDGSPTEAFITKWHDFVNPARLTTQFIKRGAAFNSTGGIIPPGTRVYPVNIADTRNTIRTYHFFKDAAGDWKGVEKGTNVIQ